MPFAALLDFSLLPSARERAKSCWKIVALMRKMVWWLRKLDSFKRGLAMTFSW